MRVRDRSRPSPPRTCLGADRGHRTGRWDRSGWDRCLVAVGVHEPAPRAAADGLPTRDRAGLEVIHHDRSRPSLAPDENRAQRDECDQRCSNGAPETRDPPQGAEMLTRLHGHRAHPRSTAHCAPLSRSMGDPIRSGPTTPSSNGTGPLGAGPLGAACAGPVRGLSATAYRGHALADGAGRGAKRPSVIKAMGLPVGAAAHRVAYPCFVGVGGQPGGLVSGHAAGGSSRSRPPERWSSACWSACRVV
jgi:hypothetical protein